MRVLVLILVVACTRPAARTSTAKDIGAGSGDGFCADFGQHCGPSATIGVECCGDLVCTPRTDVDGELLVHQCLEP